MNEAYDGWASYHARIEEKVSRFSGKTLYRYRIIRHFVTDKVWKTGFWISDRDKVVARAQEVLEGIDAKNPLRGERL